MDTLSVTLTNPEQMTPAELRAALERAEKNLFQLTLRYADLRLSTDKLCQRLQVMCEASLAGDTATVLDVAGKIAGSYRDNMNRFRTERAGRMH